MIDSLERDFYLFLLLVLVGLLMVLALGAMALGAACRRANVAVLPFRQRFWRCAWALLAGMPVLFLALVVLALTINGHRWLALLWLPLAVILVWIPISMLRRGPAGLVMLPRRRTWAASLAVLLAMACVTLGYMKVGRMMRIGELRSIAGANMNAIGKAVFLYRSDYGHVPQDLHQLAAARLIPQHSLQVISEDEGLVDDPQRPGEPLLYTYLSLPDSAPGDLLLAFDGPIYHQGEGACALYADGRVRWVLAAQFVVDLDKTYRWLLAQPTSQPATAPDQATSEPVSLGPVTGGPKRADSAELARIATNYAK